MIIVFKPVQLPWCTSPTSWYVFHGDVMRGLDCEGVWFVHLLDYGAPT